MKTCPICHSPIEITDESQILDLNNRGIYVWKDDPLLTERGLAGEDYKGLIIPNWKHIKEIQDARKAQEISAEVGNITTFSEISPTIPIHKNHILELRQSTEKILAKIGSDLTHYFNYRPGTSEGEEIYVGTYKYGEKITDKTNWTDPGLIGITKIRASHIEELRHQLYLEVPEIPLQGCLSLVFTPVIGFSGDTYDYTISLNRACNITRINIKAYLDGVDVTHSEYLNFEVTSGTHLHLIRNANEFYVKLDHLDYGGDFKVNYFDPNFQEEYWEQGWEDCRTKTADINIFELYEYSGSINGVSIDGGYPSPIQPWYGNDISPSPCSGVSFSFEMEYIDRIIGHWKCDFNYSLIYDTYWWAIDPITEYRYYPNWKPVGVYLESEGNPNPGGMISGKLEEGVYGVSRPYYDYRNYVCPQFDSINGYHFYFYFSRELIANWWYERVEIRDIYGALIRVEYQLRIEYTKIKDAYWQTTFRKYH